jgi:hypothetical protein
MKVVQDGGIKDKILATVVPNRFIGEKSALRLKAFGMTAM